MTYNISSVGFWQGVMGRSSRIRRERMRQRDIKAEREWNEKYPDCEVIDISTLPPPEPIKIHTLEDAARLVLMGYRIRHTLDITHGIQISTHRMVYSGSASGRRSKAACSPDRGGGDDPGGDGDGDPDGSDPSDRAAARRAAVVDCIRRATGIKFSRFEKRYWFTLLGKPSIDSKPKRRTLFPSWMTSPSFRRVERGCRG